MAQKNSTIQISALNNRRKRKKAWASEDLLHFSDGEVHFLWYFIQGSIMVPETRWHLRFNWGMCDRHSFAFAAVEAAFRHGFLFGQSVLYHDLMERAAAVFQTPVPLPGFAVAFQLREKEPCFMCKMGYALKSQISVPFDCLNEGRNLEPIRAFARKTEPYWRKYVCGTCAGNDAAVRCRKHLQDDLIAGTTDLTSQRALVLNLYEHIKRYARSFHWEYKKTDTIEDQASLIGSIGWLTGWRPWLVLTDEKRFDTEPPSC